MTDRVALLLHLEPPAVLDDEGIAGWWGHVGTPLVAALAEGSLPVGLCLAGPLLGWLAEARPDDHEALATLVGSGQVELIATPFHGPVVSAVPMEDFTDQVYSHLTLVRRLYEARPRGGWLPRQVWDPIAPRVLGRAEVQWVPVDDVAVAVNHPVPGVDPWGAFRTEREGHTLTLLANDGGALSLRGTASPDEVLAYLRVRHSQGARDIVLAWEAVRPGHEVDAEMRWLLGVVRALRPSDLHLVGPSQIAENVRSRLYLPSWAPEGVVVPWERRILERGAADRLHKRMLRVSRLLMRLTKRVRRGDPDAPDPDQLLQARRYLHRAQAAAHYEMPGIEDPALRHRGWRDLLRAEDVAERAAGTWQRLAAEQIDLTTGGSEQIYLRTESWVAAIDPGADAGCIELGFLPGAMNLVEPVDAMGPANPTAPPVARGGFVEGFVAAGDGLPAFEAAPGAYEVNAVERSGDRSVRAMLSRSLEVRTADGTRTARVHKGYDVRNDDRLDVAIEVHAVAPEGAPLRSRFAVQVPLIVGTPFEDLVVKVDDKVRAMGSSPLEAQDVRHVDLVGDAVVVRLSIKDRARIWVVPQALGAIVWAEWPLEVLTSAPKRLRLRLEAKRVERLPEAGDGVPMRVLEDGPTVGDTVVLQRSVPVTAPDAPAHASVTPAGVDRISRSLSLVPPRGPVARPQRLPLWAPPGLTDPDAPTPDVPTPDVPTPDVPTSDAPTSEATVDPSRDDALTRSTSGGEE